MKRVITIAGSDCSGGAGIQADLKTFSAFKVFGTSVITAVVAENTVGVQGIFPVSPEFVGIQIESVLTDIGTDAVKLGMLFDSDVVEVVSAKLKRFNPPHIVIDPVMIAKNGDELLKKEARKTLIEKLFPLCEILTPNINEAEAISGLKIDCEKNLFAALYKISEMGPQNVLIKGGHYGKEAIDFFFDGKEITEIFGKRIKTKNTHGTGCTYSSAIAALLALGNTPLIAVEKAKNFIQKAIETAPNLGKGYGPLNHFAE
jgi:hydroxymethylpyrimidine/phosphomethylpyrimidine kinase